MKDLFDYYDDAAGEEHCGLILEGGQIIELDNIHPDPTNGFEIDPRDTLRYMDRAEGVWHTHPNSTSVLSGEDKSCIEMWPKLKHWIIGKDGIRCYSVLNGAVVDEDYIPR